MRKKCKISYSNLILIFPLALFHFSCAEKVAKTRTPGTPVELASTEVSQTDNDSEELGTIPNEFRGTLADTYMAFVEANLREKGLEQLEIDYIKQGVFDGLKARVSLSLAGEDLNNSEVLIREGLDKAIVALGAYKNANPNDSDCVVKVKFLVEINSMFINQESKTLEDTAELNLRKYLFEKAVSRLTDSGVSQEQLMASTIRLVNESIPTILAQRTTSDIANQINSALPSVFTGVIDGLASSEKINKEDFINASPELLQTSVKLEPKLTPSYGRGHQ